MSATATHTITATICEALDVLLEPGSVAEARILHTHKKTVAGWFNDFGRLAEAVTEWDGKAPAVYVSLNPVHPDLLYRAVNRLKEYAEDLTQDQHILRRRWLGIDADPVRPSGISATDAEHEMALARVREIFAWLADQGWPAPVVADSGNGGHLLPRIDLPNDEASRDLLRRCLEALAFRFSDDTVTIDQGVFNAARIWKLYGTLACKGDSTPERPHRRAALLDVPDRLEIVGRDLLEKLAALAPAQPDRTATTSGDRLDLEAWFGRHGLSVAHRGPWNGGKKWILNPCPWNADHTNRAAYIVQHPNGAIAAGCHHNGCHGKGWHDLRDLVEPGWREKRKQQARYSVEIPDAPDEEAISSLVRPSFPEAAWRRGPFAIYRQAMQQATHATEEALFTGLWAAAAVCLARRVRFYLGIEVFPNVALAIFGETGDGKTTAARHGVDRLHALAETIGVLRGGGSGEGVVDWLRDPKEAHLWFAEEYSEILIRAGWDGATIKSVIVNLLDCPPEYELRFRKDKRGGEAPPKLTRPTLNLLVCTTPATFWKYLRDEDFESGFGNRWLYLAGSKRPVISRPDRPDARLVAQVERTLTALTQLPETECHLTPEAGRLWDDFYNAWDAEPWKPLTRVAVKRVPQYVLKLAMLYAAFEETIPQITADQVEAAILVGHYAARCTDTLMHDLKPGGFRGRLETRILEIVSSTPLPPYKIKRQVGGGVAVEDVDRAIKALEKAGELERVGRTTEGRPVWGRVGVSYGK
jgi:hypothetical protein